jgi:hypothetical protein
VHFFGRSSHILSRQPMPKSISGQVLESFSDYLFALERRQG